MAVSAVFSIKGGVGKTAAAVNLAALSAVHGRRVLLWDLDPQGAATWYLQGEALDNTPLKRLLKGKGIGERIRPTAQRNLFLLPSDPHYRDLERVLDDMKRSTLRLREMLGEIGEDFDEIWIDCPPGLSLLADNLFRAVDRLIVPLVPTWLSERAYLQLVEDLRERCPHPPQLLAFLSMVDRRRALHRDFYATHGASLPGLLPVEIPYASLIEQMGEARAPLVWTHSRSEPAQAYFRLWKQLEQAG
ncbi:MAG: ParA family protein [Halothiobacillaceae bacterium]|jgi:cellulose biosynthesis protein BcsQ|nr:ParA family protein [Halothiobacillaceae bacterium]MDY0050050.1 ParA family protein [Halothiobacillaceae bacterium]